MTEPIRYRPSWRQNPKWVLLIPASQVLTMVFVDLPREVRVIYLGNWCVFAVVVWWTRRTVGVELTDDALVVRRIRRRVLPWRRIEWVGVAPQWGTRTVGVRYGGRLRRLPAPYHHRFFAPDPDFEAKAQTIYETWVRATT